MSGEVVRIERAFVAARQRFCAATASDAQEDEASNMLHHFYRLVERHGGVRSLGAPAASAHASALCLLRNVDTHEATIPAATADVVSRYVTQLIATLVWRMPPAVQQDHRYVPTDARHLEGRPVVDSISAAFAALRAVTN